MDANKFLQSKVFKRIVIGVGLLFIVFVSFGAGILVGYSKARFSYAWQENYNHNFGKSPRGIFGPPANPGPINIPGFPPNPQFMSAHGMFGTILSIVSSSIAINGEDGIEKTALLSSSTIVREGHSDVGMADLGVGDSVVIIGSPNKEGQIEARFIRVLW